MGRLQSKDYRGVHFSQHYRKDIELLEQVLSSIEEVAKEGFIVPPGDYRKYVNNLSEYKVFDNIVSLIKEKREKNIEKKKRTFSHDSLKKVLLVDFSRMGFLKRYNKKGIVLDNKKRSPIYFCKLSDEGLLFLKSENIFEKYRTFTKSLDVYFEGFFEDLFTKLHYSKYRKEKISIYGIYVYIKW